MPDEDTTVVEDQDAGTVTDPDDTTTDEQPDLAALEAARALADSQELAATLEATVAAQTRELADMRLASIKTDISHTTGVPTELLRGNNADELNDHADRLREWRDNSRTLPPKRGPLRSGFTTTKENPSPRQLAVHSLNPNSYPY